MSVTSHLPLSCKSPSKFGLAVFLSVMQSPNISLGVPVSLLRLDSSNVFDQQIYWGHTSLPQNQIERIVFLYSKQVVQKY